MRDPEVLLLDEPTNNLDLQRQLEVMEHVRRSTRSAGLVTVVTLHDLNLAARFADRCVVLADGEVYADGRPEEALHAGMLADVYGVEGEVTHASDGSLQVHVRQSIRSERTPASAHA